MKYSSTPQTPQIFDRLADEYESRWAQYLTHTHQKFLEKIHLDKDDKVLDMSCGTGLLAYHLIERGDKFREIVLNDISTKLQARAKKRFKGRDDIRFTSLPAESVDFPAETFDKIFCLSAFHNYSQQSCVLQNCRHILKPGGRMYLLDWNRSGWFRIVDLFIKIKTPEYIDTRSRNEMKQKLTDHSFSIIFDREWYFNYWKFFYLIVNK